jgi:hypothetical protein
MKLLGKSALIAAGVAAAGTAGAALFRKPQSKTASVVKNTGKLLVVGILGRRVLTRLVTRLVKKTVQLKVCQIRLQGRQLRPQPGS